ncbi:glycosyltransferase family 2 protein [Marinovum sp. 1_MG-2023]|uniref:glycosyltransferase family 2 protein n=2 Tax=unclassified Marinovum TaxID=2647166 RepID=UPI0026E1A409|nr:glycosyltransferase family 2 protein [Marinovum sp. 1_MG-2023]
MRATKTDFFAMTEYRIEDAGQLAKVVQGKVDKTRLTLFSTMKNEMAFLPAFLSHYRSIGFEQFLIFDDASDDGTFEYLSAQPDCVVMQSRLTFGDEVRYRDPDGELHVERAGSYFKIALPHMFFDNAFVAYVDADEFMFLPPGVTSVADVVDRLRQQGATSAIASVVEFFPADVSGLTGDMPHSFQGLLQAYGYFQSERLVQLIPGQMPQLQGKSKTARLFGQFGVAPKVARKGLQRLYMSSRAKKAQQFQKSPRHKTPLVCRSDTSRLTGSHAANLPPSDTVLLTIAHFVFTAQFADKIARAQSWGAHANGAAKYRYYAELLDKMQAEQGRFLDENSVKFQDVQQFMDCGLMTYPNT